MKDCGHCDGTGSACNACNAGIMDCDCGPDQEPTMCDKCDGSGLALLTERLWPGAGVAVAAGAAIVIARLAELVRDEMRKQED